MWGADSKSGSNILHLKGSINPPLLIFVILLPKKQQTLFRNRVAMATNQERYESNLHF